LRDAAGQTVFVHEYRPHRLAEQAWASFTRGGSLLHPPALSVLSLAFPDRAFAFAPSLFLDQVVAAGERSLLLPLGVLTILLAGLSYRRLARFEVPALRRWAWVGAILVGGVPVFLCGIAIETRRAWGQMAAETKAGPLQNLLIQSA
jgi:hypothetical protein